ncbi:MAG: acetyl-CoA hydrolase, partial [Actinomycetota bacterium]|nr:acetyl-CoA hydrolase [Actinomycetota bacterium]
MATSVLEALERHVGAGDLVVIGDGASTPVEVCGDLAAHARQVGAFDLLLGWWLAPMHGIDWSAFRRVRTVLAGYGLRTEVDAGHVDYLPVRMGATPALLAHERPAVAIANVADSADGPRLRTESSLARLAVENGATLIGLRADGATSTEAEAALTAAEVSLVDVELTAPFAIDPPGTDDVSRAIGATVADLLPSGVRLQIAPGPLGAAVLDAFSGSIHIDTGVINDAVMDAVEAGKIEGDPLAPYVVGSSELYRWAADRRLTRSISVTHDPARLASGRPLVAVNTALQIDLDGQVNVERITTSALAGIGGQPDYAAAATWHRDGLS